MRRGWADTLWRSTSFRLALVQAIILSVALAGAGIAVSVITRDVAERDLRARIELESSAVLSELSGEGLNEAAAAVRARAMRPGALEYLLVDPAGRHIAGDLPDTGSAPGWRHIEVRHRNETASLLTYSVSVKGGARLVVGDDLKPARNLANALLRALLIWGGGALLLGLALGIWATRRALARMSALGRTLERVSAGDLSERTQVAVAGGDDIDLVARRVNAMLDRIGQLVQSQRRVSADVAHELRSPLTLVRRSIARAEAASNVSERVAALAAADAAVGDALRLFDAMLRLAEIEAGNARQRFTRIDLGSQVFLIVDAYRADIEAAGRALETDIAGAVSVWGDPDLLGLAVSNLLENAMKHTPAGARIAVAISRHAGRCWLDIEDGGAGMSAAEFSRAVAPFTRLDAARSTTGAGLGLAIVAAVMRLHDADFEHVDKSGGLHLRCSFPVFES